MANEYIKGINDIYYVPTIDDDMTVTAYFYSPEMVKSDVVTFIKQITEGMYKGEFEFTNYGKWIGVFFENGVRTFMQTFNIERPSAMVWYRGRPL